LQQGRSLRAIDCATPRPSNNGSGLTTPRTPASDSNFLIKRDFIACVDLPTIGERVQRRVDAANLDDLIRQHGPYAFAIVGRSARAQDKESRQCSGSGRPTGRSLSHRRAGDPRPPRVASEVEEGARQQRRRNVARSRDRDLARPGRAVLPQARSQPRRGRLARDVWLRQVANERREHNWPMAFQAPVADGALKRSIIGLPRASGAAGGHARRP
jgi:hypothetical protein